MLDLVSEKQNPFLLCLRLPGCGFVTAALGNGYTESCPARLLPFRWLEGVLSTGMVVVSTAPLPHHAQAHTSQAAFSLPSLRERLLLCAREWQPQGLASLPLTAL